MLIEKMTIDKLLPAGFNPRKDLKQSDPEYQRLKKSILEFDYIDPVIWNKQSGRVVGGHQRLKILKELGHTEIEVSVVNLPDDKEKALNIALNKTGGDWDMLKLKDLLEELDAGEMDLELTGFGLDEIEDIFNKYKPVEVEEDGFDAEAEAKNIIDPVTKLGDVWKLGRHRLMCGDSTSVTDAEKLMDGKKANLVFTDPPYGYEYQSNMRTKSEKFDVLKNDDKILDFMLLVDMFSKGFVFVCASWKTLDKWLVLFKNYFELSNMIIWNKGGGGIGDLKKTFLTDYEVILVSHRGNEIKGKRIGSVWDIKKDKAKEYVHATQKPIKLAAQAIEETTLINSIILDFFGGSGSTLMAAEQTNRIAYLMELDPIYCDVIIKRWEQLTGEKAELVGG